MPIRVFTALLHKENDMYVAKCPEVGTASQGYTIEEAVANLKEATELYLEEMGYECEEAMPGKTIVTSFEAVCA
ncbi:MAG: type II toxin-antitoxin system HicB family antitoxin [Anaerolineae bacterium]